MGEERYLVNEQKEKLKNAIVDKSLEMMNVNAYDGKDIKINEVINIAVTAPFMSDKRLIVISNSGLFKDGRKDDTKRLADLVKDDLTSDSDTILLFYNEVVDKRNSLYKAIKKYGYVCEISGLREDELVSWLVSYSNNRLNRITATYFVRNIGTNMDIIVSEYDKLMAYVGDEDISNEDIDIACSRSDEINIYDMVDAIGNKKPNVALDIYNNMLFNKSEPVAIMGMVSRQFRLILKCKYLQISKKYNSKQIAVTLKMNEFVVKKCMEQGKNFKITTLIDALKDCSKCDNDFRQGLLDIKLGLEIIILKYSK